MFIYGLLSFISGGIATLCVAIVILARTAGTKSVNDVVKSLIFGKKKES